MLKSSSLLAGALFLASLLLSSVTAQAACVRKGAEATAVDTDTAVWLAMETIVQQVDIGMWPGWVATGDTPGYNFTKKKKRCSGAFPLVTCRVQTVVCPKK